MSANPKSVRRRALFTKTQLTFGLAAVLACLQSHASSTEPSTAGAELSSAELLGSSGDQSAAVNLAPGGICIQWSPIRWEEIWYTTSPEVLSFTDHPQLLRVPQLYEPAWRYLEPIPDQGGFLLMLANSRSVSGGVIGADEVRNLAASVSGVRVLGLHVLAEEQLRYSSYDVFRQFRGLQSLIVSGYPEGGLLLQPDEPLTESETEDDPYEAANRAIQSLKGLTQLTATACFTEPELSALMGSLPSSMRKISIHCTGDALAALITDLNGNEQAIESIEVIVRGPTPLAFGKELLADLRQEMQQIWLGGAEELQIKGGNWDLQTVRNLRFRPEVKAVAFEHPRMVSRGAARFVPRSAVGDVIAAFRELVANSEGCSISIGDVRVEERYDMTDVIAAAVPGLSAISQ